MRTIKIGEKEYPFILSAAAAKEYFSGKFEQSEEDKFNLNASVKLVYTGLKDARLLKSWWYNLWNPIPREENLARMLDANQITEAIRSLFPEQKPIEGAEQKEVSEKKH